MLLNIRPKVLFRNWLKIGFILSLTLVIFGSLAAWQIARPASRGEQLVLFNIEDGETVYVISQNLKDANLINSSWWFEAWVWITDNESQIISGNYSLPANINIVNLVRLISGGVNPSSEVEIRIIEGWTINKIASYLNEENIVSKEDFINFTTSSRGVEQVKNETSNNMLNSLPIGQGLEGYLFPDTYRIYKDSGSYDIVAKMVDNLASKFPISWQHELDRQGYSIHECLTLASIIEMEVSTDVDRALVADIFIRRLSNNIGLQADSTINYISGKSVAAVSLDDLQIDSPYNTYKYKGLPPGPISNPGLSSIKAVVFPKPNSFWYFLTTKDGKVIYSKTFEQHKQAKRQYLQ